MGQEKKPDFVMTAEGELVPTDDVRSADLPKKIELPAFAPKAAPKKPPPPLPPPDPKEDRIWTGERTKPDPAPSPAANALAQLALEEGLEVLEPIGPAVPVIVDDLALPASPRPPPPPPPDEEMTSPAEVEHLIRDQNYRAVIEQVADIDGDETLDDPQPPPPMPPPKAPSQDIPVIRGTAVTPPPPPRAPEPPPPPRPRPRIGLVRDIKEKNRGR